jgi:hypothetical protein
MVDQLWMWILDESMSVLKKSLAHYTDCTAETIITSFPRRWGKNKPVSSSSLRESAAFGSL